jgi:hypothetical protein
MFAGHYGPSLAVRAVRPEVPLWLLFVAAQLVDIWLFRWPGWTVAAHWIDRQRMSAGLA